MRTISSLREWIFVFATVAAFSAAAFLLLGDHGSVSTESGTAGAGFDRPQAAPRSGTIITREHGQCRQLRFDQATGEIEDSSLGPCPRGDATAVNSTEGRMQSIRKSFSGR